MSNPWRSVLVLDKNRQTTAGSTKELSDAVRRGADLRIYTEFRHNEHIDITSANRELVQEVSDFRVTYLLDDRWAAGIMNLRQPISLPDGFGPRPSMSFFAYNQDGAQAIARQYLDPESEAGMKAAAAFNDYSAMPKYHLSEAWDEDTRAPSRNFVYDFDAYRYYICDNWEQLLAHGADGQIASGSVDSLAAAVAEGREVKVAISQACADLVPQGTPVLPHEVFVHCGPCYYYPKQRLLIAGTQPVVRIRPAIPLAYHSEGWNSGWLMVRTDGYVAGWLVDPYTLTFHRSHTRHALRWFVR